MLVNSKSRAAVVAARLKYLGRARKTCTLLVADTVAATSSIFASSRDLYTPLARTA